MKLTTLEIWSTIVENLGALEGMPLEYLSIRATLVTICRPCGACR